MSIRLFAAPLIGAVIGYFTNYIAVKMLFYPRKEIRVFGHKLPFTPGAIPKGKDRLGRAIGKAVGDTLLTKEDIEKKLLAPEVSEGIVSTLTEGFHYPVKNQIRQAAGMSEYDYIMKRESLAKLLTAEITDALAKMDLSDLLVNKGIQLIRENVTNPMIAMFLSDELLASILGPMGPQLQAMILENGPEMIEPAVTEKIRELEQQSAQELLGGLGVEEYVVHSVLSSMIQKMLKNSLSKVLDTLDIQKTVEAKIEEMSIDELEDLVMTVMKNELNMIVNLGALIGLILGMINLLF